MGTNRNYKDRLFRLLFGDERYKQNALDLYNAVNETSYSDKNELIYDTIEDVIYMGMKNDTSFIIHDDLNIYEQQSSFNPNMPVRGLMYLGKMFDKFIEVNHLNQYGHELIKFPSPQYIVFYNGTEKEYQDQDMFELRLSNAFQKPGCVEMTAKVYNINYGHNAKLMDTCRSLSEYAQFVAMVRDYSKRMETEKAIDLAVRDCIERNILKDILLQNKAEVKDMVLTEYDEVKTMNNFYADGKTSRDRELIEKAIKRGDSLESIAAFMDIPLEKVKNIEDELKELV